VKNKKDISFQDMQSIGRAFKDYVGVALTRDEHTNNVILAQACRHVFAHTRGIADAPLVKQIANVSPRTLKVNLRLGEALQFSPEEVRIASDSMVIVIDRLAESVEEVCA
jgi:hypothetical protein